MSRKLILLLLASLLIACGGDYDDDDNDNDDVAIQEEQRPVEFSTRLTNDLNISGRQCLGNETTGDPENPDEICERDEYLISVDNKNVCAGDICTEIAVKPFVGKLEQTEVTSSENANFYKITPESPITGAISRIIGTIWIRQDKATGETSVVNR